MEDTDTNFVVMAKGVEKYVLVFDEAHRADAMRTLGRWASDPQLSLTWMDAAELSSSIRNMECVGK